MPTFFIVDAQDLTDPNGAFAGVSPVPNSSNSNSDSDWNNPNPTAGAGDTISATSAGNVAITINETTFGDDFNNGSSDVGHLLVDPVTVNGTTYPAGSRIETDYTALFKEVGTDQYYLVGHVSINSTNDNNNDDTFVGVIISRPFDASDDEVKLNQLYVGGTDLEVVSRAEAQGLSSSSAAFRAFSFDDPNRPANQVVDWSDGIGTGSGPGSSNAAAYDNDIDYDLTTGTIPTGTPNANPVDGDETDSFAEGDTTARVVDAINGQSPTTDSDGDTVILDNTFTPTVATTGANGSAGTATVDPITGNVTYNPTGNEVTGDVITVTYQVTDQNGGTDQSTVTITVTPPDKDGDGVTDDVDLDDDNDGITDVEEGQGQAGGGEPALSGGGVPSDTLTPGAIGYDSTAWNNVLGQLNSSTSGLEDFEGFANGTDFSDQTYNGFTITNYQDSPTRTDEIVTGTNFGASPVSGSNQVAIGFPGSPSQGDFVEFTITFDQPVFGWGLNIGDFHDYGNGNGNDLSKVTVSTDGIPIWESEAQTSTTGTTTVTNDADPNSPNFTVGNGQYIFLSYYDPNNPVTEITVRHDSTLGNNVFDTYVLDDISYILPEAPTQDRDTDGDGIPDYCDLDSDNDGISDIQESGVDISVYDTDGNGFIDANEIVDTDGDGLDDRIEADALGIANPTLTQLQNNESGTAPVDTDGDGLDDYIDIDADNDGITDFIENQPSATFQPYDDTDSDNDGIIDIFDNDTGGTPIQGGDFGTPENTDGTDVADYLDSDSDNDGLTDTQESGLETPLINPDGTLTNDANNDGLADEVLGFDIDNQDGPITAGGVAGLETELENTTDADTSDVDFRSSDGSPNDEDESNSFTEGSTTPFTTDVVANATDPNGDTVTLQSIDTLNAATTGSSLGTFSIVGGEVQYQPTGLEQPGDIITLPYTVTDGNGGTDTSTLTITIEPDKDRDGVADDDDIDDDNDGILDVEEGTVEVTANTFAGGWSVDPDSDGSGNVAVFDLGNGVFARAVKVDDGNDFSEDTMNAALNSGEFSDPNVDGAVSLQANYAFETQLTISFEDASGDPVQVSDVVLHIDRIGGFETIGGVITPNAATVTLENGLTWQELSGTTDFETTSTTATDADATAGTAATSPPFQSGNAGPNDTAAGSLQIDQALSSFTVSFPQNGPDGADLDGIELALEATLLLTRDTDGDGVPDSCDLDSDNDGISDLEESGVDVSVFDPDRNGTIDVDGNGDPLFVDNNEDGLDDNIDLADDGLLNGSGTDPRDFDMDGVDDYLDLDSDDDGISDFIEAQPTVGYEGTDGDVTDDDADGDGVIDIFETNNVDDGLFGGAFNAPVDTDEDGTPDYLDLDSDDDTLLTNFNAFTGTDEEESGLDNTGPDSNDDGISDTVGASYTDPSGGVDDLLLDLENLDGDPTEADFRAPCFVRGTKIATRKGEVPIENLKVGDRVLTVDNGFQEIRWIGSRKVAAIGRLAPIVIADGIMGNDGDLLVSPLHRMLLRGWKAELLTGEREVLIPAKMLVNDSTIRAREGGEVEYFHILFDNHEIVLANGCASESFHPGQVGLDAFEDETREEILTIFPELRALGTDAYGPPARTIVKRYEAAIIAAE